MNELENLYNISCSIFGIERNVNKGRNRTYVYARYLYYYFARQIIKDGKNVYSLNQIGAVIRSKGGDHSTVMSGEKRMKDFIETKDKIIYSKYLEMKYRIENTDLTGIPEGVIPIMINNLKVTHLGIIELIETKKSLIDKLAEVQKLIYEL